MLPALLSIALSAAQLLPPGHRPEPPGVHALVGGTVFVRAGEKIEEATILIRNGRIAAVGKNLEIPKDARVSKLGGLSVYPGFIDPYLSLKPSTNVLGFQFFDDDDHATYAEPRAAGLNFFGVSGQEIDPGAPGPGYVLAQVTPERAMAETYTHDEKALEDLRELGFTAGNIVPQRGVVRGSSAFVLLGDEGPNRSMLRRTVAQHAAFEVASPKDDAFPRSLMGAIAAVRQSFLDAKNHAAGGETKSEINLALAALAPAAMRMMPVVFEPGSALMNDRAARTARELGLDFQIVSSGQEWRRPDLVKDIGAPFIVPLNFPEPPKLPEEDDWAQVSLDSLRAWDWAPENAVLLRQQGAEIALTLYGLNDRKAFRKNLRAALDRGLSEADALSALTTVPARLCGMERDLGTIEQGKLANLTVVEGSFFNPQDPIRDVWINGRVYRAQPGVKAKKSAEGDDKKKEEEKRRLAAERLARSPQEGRGSLASPKALLVRGAMIWTCGPEGKIENGDLLIEDGKIRAVGKNLAAEGAEVIEAQGKHLTPGLIDCHSHAMIMGGVNEATLPNSALVRVGDVVNSEAGTIREQLAGGLTAANLLHGSANPIGGQNCVIKLRDGASPEGLKLAGAPEGIKFALGENVKQSNWGADKTTRFPQSRMGVPTFMANRFTAARQYRARWQAWEADRATPEPRRDLELEALVEILEGRRLIHCHSYRQDEIFVFLQLMESLGIRVATLQHVLEGYKVADEIARHGAGASCFSDWWAFKFEVYDAIPYAGALMHQRGVLVSFNSDSSDLARRLNFEAAKAVKYGGVPEEEALKFVTLNPAKQLRIDASVGSLEPGKDADFALWSRSPLDSLTVCEQTWIDGRKYYDRTLAEARAQSLREERNRLLEKAKKAAGLAKPGDNSAQAQAAFFQLSWEMAQENRELHCDAP